MKTFAPFCLPSSSQLNTADPLSVVEDSAEDVVTLWDALSILLPRARSLATTSELISLMEDIAYTCHGDGKADFSLLQTTLDDDADTWNVFREAIPHLVDLALRMPLLFPTASLDPLSIERSSVTLSQVQIACINVHAFLGTLGMPEWNDWGGVNLYPHWFGAGVDTTRELRTSYIRITLAYFQQLDHYLQGEPVTFNLSTTAHGADANLAVPLVSLHIGELDEADDNPQVLSGLERYAQVVGAHRNIGFGPAATQEERVFAAAPALRVAPLFVPPLAAESALLISGGVRPLAHFKGHLRSARLVSIYALDADTPTEQSWLFMDAAELDAWLPPNDSDSDALPDLHPHILQRELTKLLAGFSGLARGTDVVSIPWGCGAFGGDVRVKVLLLWIAASASGNVSRLHFTAPAGGLAVLQQLQSLSARTLWDVLHSDALRSAPSYWAAPPSHRWARHDIDTGIGISCARHRPQRGRSGKRSVPRRSPAPLTTSLTIGVTGVRMQGGSDARLWRQRRAVATTDRADWIRPKNIVLYAVAMEIFERDEDGIAYEEG